LNNAAFPSRNRVFPSTGCRTGQKDCEHFDSSLDLAAEAVVS
jgi:hypothetical protein